MDPRCRVEMLGPLRLKRDGQTLTRFGTQKAAALLAYLALRPGPQSREQIIDTFWPEMDLSAGRNNLNTALSALRHVLEPAGVRKGAVLVTSHAHVGLDPAAVTTDVAEFERLLAQSDRAEATQERADLLGQALTLWTGEFQSGNYQDWAVRESERLSAQRVGALERWGEDLEALGRFADAAEASRRRLEVDPYEETGYVARVRRLTLAGQTGTAREAAAQFERFFREEFGAAPSPASQNAIAELLPQRTAAPAAPPPSPSSRQTTPSPKPSPQEPSESVSPPTPAEPTAPTLPFWLSRFFGRETELAQFAALLLSPKEIPEGPDLPPRPCRLVTLLGPGGAGKTRLAAEFARLATERHGLFCAFVPLADLSAADQIASQIAQTLRLSPSRTLTPLDQVIGFLRERDRPGAPPVLLILDNLEHLLPMEQGRTDGGAGKAVVGVVQTLLRDAPGLTLLTTSRHRLGLQGERLVSLGPLPVPDLPDDRTSPEHLAEMLHVPSVRLYVDRAQSVRPDFGLTAINAPAVASLCRTLEGSPLALELAASWVRLLPPRKMWERLAQGQTMPESRHEDLPDRHRSLSAALDWSWRLLTDKQRRLLAHISVFRGGWPLEAAEGVCEEPDALGVLASLQEASLVTATETAAGETRYSLLETVRQYAGEQLRERGEEEAVRGRHATYFLAMAEEAEPELFGPDQKQWLERLETEHDNLRTAQDWAAARPEASETGLKLAAALGKFWSVRGHLTEGRTRLYAALTRTQGTAPAVHAKALYEAGSIASHQGDHREAKRLLEECLAIRREAGDHTGCAGALRMLGIEARTRGDLAGARALLTEGLCLYQKIGDKQGIVGTITSLGNLAMLDGDLETAHEHYARSLPLYRANGDRRGTAVALGNLGNVAGARLEYGQAQERLKECLEIYAELGDLRGCAITQHSQAVVALKTGDNAGALRLLRECLASCRKLGDRQGSLGPLEAIITILTRTGQAQSAARLWAALGALHDESGITLTPREQAYRDEQSDQLLKSLGTAAFSDATAAGQLLSWEETLTDALQDGAPGKE